jgi:hypothetical protein
MKNFGFLAFLLTLSFGIQAQRSIRGSVANQKGEKLSYCTIEIRSAKDSSFITATASDSAGYFSATISQLAPLLIKVSFLGYKKLTVRSGADPAKKEIDLGILTLENDGAVLQEVVISNAKNVIEKKIDRLVFNVENILSAQGSNAADLLARTPLVQLNGNSISIIGKGSVSILLNDKLFYLSGEELLTFLRSIPAENIVRIEVITNPPAKYDAAAGGALINIVTRKNRLPGTNGSVNAAFSQGYYPSGQAGFSVNSRRKKANLSANLSLNKGSTYSNELTQMLYTERSFYQTEHTRKNSQSLNAAGGIDYELTSKNTCSLLYTASLSKSQSAGSSQADYRGVSNIPDSSMWTSTNYDRYSNNQSAGFNFTRSIDSTGKKLSIDADFNRYYNNRSRSFTEYTIEALAGITGSNINLYNTSDQLISIGTLKTDIEWPNKILRVDYGAKFNWIENQSTNFVYNNLGGNQLLDSAQSNSFNYTENTEAAYVNTRKKWNKLETQAGLRLENTTLSGYTPSQKEHTHVVNRTYLNLFPTAYALYTFNDNNSLTFTYDYRIDRPVYSSLNPFRYYLTPYIYTEGNPYLKPSYYNTMELGYTFQHKYIFSLAYTGMIDSYSEVPVQITQQTLAYLQQNVGNTYQYTAYCVFPFQLKKYLEGSVVFAYVNSNYHTSLSNFSPSTKNIFLCDLNTQFYWGHDNKFSGELNAHLLPLGTTFAVMEMGPQYIVDAGIKMALLQGKASLKLSANDIFFAATPSGKTVSPQLTILNNNTYDTRNIRVAFTCLFGYKGLKGRRNRDTGDEEEKNRIKSF